MIKDCPKRTLFLTQPANLESSTTTQEVTIEAETMKEILTVMTTEIADVVAIRPRVTEMAVEVEGVMVKVEVEVAVTAEEETTRESTVVIVVGAVAPREEVVLREDVTEVPAPAEADDHKKHHYFPFHNITPIKVVLPLFYLWLLGYGLLTVYE